MAAPTSLRLVDQQPDAEPLAPSTVQLPGDDDGISLENGALKVERPDGSVTIDLNPDLSGAQSGSGDFYRNLALEIAEADLAAIATDLLTGIEYDEQSRREWLETRATGIKLLALKLEEPRGDVGTSSAPLEGMATIRHPLLLEATVRFQATARGELLPAAGPVKVRNDATPAPEPPAPGTPPAAIGHNGGPSMTELDDLGTALEKDMNHYLTVTASEYVADTDRMLFYIGFGGDGFKKVYNCPLRRRPVSESVDAENIIVSNAATDLQNCGRVTHRIKMRPSVLRRMQIVGEYRDVPLNPPNPSEPVNAVDKEKAAIAGVKPQPQRPKDNDYTVYEVYCELDLDKFAPDQFKGKALPLPYVVTLEKESRQVLQVRRNWNEDDPQCLAKRFFVQFPFIRGLGFYGLGLIHLLGNVTMTLTAVWREFIDSGMFANFSGWLFAKGAGRQLTNQLRVPPGGGIGVDVPPGMRIQDAFMPLPYKEPGASFSQFVTHVEEVGQRLGQTADVNIGEGKQDMPVGTTMALIEQSTKVIDSVHKRLHAAQAEEFALLKERFREDPEAFWRHNKKPARQWQVEEFKRALEQRELVPVADPNNPTSLHRIAKATIIDALVTKYQQLFNAPNAVRRILRVAGIDAEGLLNAQPAPPPPDPRFAAIQAKAQAEAMKAEIDKARVLIQAQTAQANFADKQAERAFKERMQQFEMYLEAMRVQAEAIIHAHDLHRDNVQAASEIETQRAQAAHEIAMDHAAHQQDMTHEAQRHELGLAAERARAEQQGGAVEDRHEQQMRHADEKHEAQLAHQRAMAAAKPKPGEK
jgi:hypothetical protein